MDNDEDPFEQEMEDGTRFLPKGPGMYCILNRINGRRYVGQAVNIYTRCRQHRYELRRGQSSNMLMRHDPTLRDKDAFFFFVLRLDGISELARPFDLDKVETWLVTQLRTHDERFGYNMEAGHHRTRAARFRDRERKLMRGNSRKYEFLPGINIYDPIHPDLLSSWIPGN